MTNFEKIKSLSIEDMARFIIEVTDSEYKCDYCIHKYCSGIDGMDCVDGIKTWLKKEYDKDF